MSDGKPLYRAKSFAATTVYGTFEASGTLCGHIDFTGPFGKTYALSPDEVAGLIAALQHARADVLGNSDPTGDTRLVDDRPTRKFRVVKGEP